MIAKYISKSLVVLALVAGGSAFAKSDGVAVVYLQEVAQKTPLLESFRKKVADKFKPKEEVLVAEQKSLEKKIADFQKNMTTLSAKKKKATEKSLRKAKADFDQKQKSFQQELFKVQNDGMKVLMDKYKGAAKSVAESNGYSMVVQGHEVLFHKPNADITSKVVAFLLKK